MPKCNKRHNKKIAFMRLKRNKGSVLFFVVAIMSVMVILASAVYYAATSARKQVVVRYDSQQAYQSAIALNDIIVDFISKKTDDGFVQSIIGLDVNESITTTGSDPSGFSELAAGLGDYKVSIKKVQGGLSDAEHVLEIKTDISVNGEKATLTTVGEFKVQSKPYNYDRFFTSTGYAPNDVLFKNMKNDSTVYLDNEYTQFGGEGSGDLTISTELIAAGSVRFESPAMLQNIDLTIGNNAYFFSANSFSLKSCRIGGNAMLLGSFHNPSGDMRMYILGDYYLGKQPNNAGTYVNGDMVYTDQNPPNDPAKIYVNGDLFLYADRVPNCGGKFVVGGNVYFYGDDNNNNEKAKNYKQYCKGNVYNLKKGYVIYQNGSEGAISAQSFDRNKMYFKLQSSTDYQTDEEIRRNLDYIEAFCGTSGGGYTDVWPSQSGSCEDVVTVKLRINEKIGDPEYINWDLERKFVRSDGTYNVDSSKLLNLQLEIDEGTVIKATTANDYYVLKSVSGGSSRSTIIFDTFMGNYNRASEVADKTKYANMYIYLEPNCYVEVGQWGSVTLKTDDPSKFDSFSWEAAQNGNGTKFIFTRGMGSVTFVVPEGVRYIQPNDGYVGHLGMFETMIGDEISIIINNNGTLSYGQCPKDGMDTGVEQKIRNKLTTSTQGTNAILDSDTIDQFDDANDPTDALYIHNNVFLVTISKNAIMDFSGGQNMFAGYVYAPYITYNSEGIYQQTQSGMVGGLIVSDLIQSRENDNYVCMTPYDYYGRYVDSSDSAEEQEKDRIRYMEKLMNESGSNTILSSTTSRSWRKYGYN